MTLTLRVISAQCEQLGQDCSRQFTAQGGRIGRCDDNEWVLPDPDRYLSSYHAQIHFDAGRWILEDLSTNGVYVNDATLPVSQLGPCELHDGDQLRMGDYQILVSLDEQVADKITHVTHKPNKNHKKTRKALVSTSQPDNELKFDLDLSELFTGYTPAHTKNTPKQATQELPHAKKSPPNTQAKSAPISEPIIQLLASNELDTVIMDEASQGGLAAFCRGAGIEIDELPSHSDAALLALAGQLLRAAVLEMMSIEKLRSETRKISATIDHASTSKTDNWIKNSTDVDEALIKLLSAARTRRANPVDMIRENFKELRSHEQATLTALFTAIHSLMKRFNPEELQPRFDRILSRGKANKSDPQQQYWLMYGELFQAINQRNKEGLPISFTEEFAQAYQAKFAELANQDKKRSS
jgi:type VI secretion system FHA domain protein